MGSESMVNLERVQALETWLERTNIKLTQVNGQRKYGGPPEVWSGPTPGAHCEVFISQIPRDTYEDLLIPLFSSVGPLWEFRLMMNFSGQNRGFAYAKYGSPSVASEAIRLLDGQVLESGSCLIVRHSTEKRSLCIDHLPLTSRQEDLMQVMHVLTNGVERVCLMTRAGVEGVKVTAKVTFSSHYAASMAKKMLVGAFKEKFSLTISVKWESAAKPKPLKGLSPEINPPCSVLNPLRAWPVLPPRLAHRHPSFPPGFCCAAGGLANQLRPRLSYYSSFYCQQ